jgi:hypothetical protein
VKKKPLVQNASAAFFVAKEAERVNRLRKRHIGRWFFKSLNHQSKND